MSNYLTKTVNHSIYIIALDIENTEYLHGPFKYRDSAIRWAKANSNPNLRPLARLEGTDIESTPLVTSSFINLPYQESSKELKTFPAPSQEILNQFYLLYGDGSGLPIPYQINNSTGLPEPIAD
jgi:hypothetical protein